MGKRRKRASQERRPTRGAVLPFRGGFMLRKSITKQVPIPHEPGEWLEVRLLGWKELESARRERQRTSFANIREMGADLFRQMQDSRGDAAGPADAMQQYDQGVVLEKGITGWSYPDPVSAETIALLDPITAEWAARLIVGAEPERESDRKNGSGSSISPSPAEGAHQTSG
jgi:hypothetical protein